MENTERIIWAWKIETSNHKDKSQYYKQLSPIEASIDLRYGNIGKESLLPENNH